MNIKLIKLLVSVGIGLCLVIAGEWLYASYMQASFADIDHLGKTARL